MDEETEKALKDLDRIANALEGIQRTLYVYLSRPQPIYEPAPYWTNPDWKPPLIS